MEVFITNQIAVYKPSDELIRWVNENLVVTNPLYTQLKVTGKEDLIQRKHVPSTLNLFSKIRGGALILPFGCLYSIWRFIKNGNLSWNFNVCGDISIKNDEPTYPPFDYQKIAIQQMIKAGGGILQAPCGSGKTNMGIEILRRIGRKTLWLCHTGDLLRQAKKDMEKQYPNIKIGLTTAGKLEIGDDVTISTVQTMDKIDPHLYENEFEVVIVDECSHCAGSPTQTKMFQRVVSNIKARYKYGLTATPDRSDGIIKSMFAYLGVNPNGEFESTYKVPKEVIKTIIAKHERFEINSGYNEFNMRKIYNYSGQMEFNKLISELSSNSERTDKIVQNIINCHKQGRKQAVLSLRVEHCEEFVAKLNSAGIKAVLCTGKTKDKDRNAILNQQVEWDVVVSTFALFKEGISINELDTMHLTLPVNDKATTVQCAGRVERYLENKKQPIVYDYVDVDIPYCEKKYTNRRRSLKSRF